MKVNNVTFAHCVGLKSQLPEPGLPEFAFVGRSNVGKSSLLNRLINRKKLARTSGQPGKTQTLNFYLVNDALYLVDLPGYGYAKVSKAAQNKWRVLLEHYLSQRLSLTGVALVVDSRHSPSALDVQMFEWLQYYNRPLFVIATKVDKLSRRQFSESIKNLQAAYNSVVIPFSSTSGLGREEVWRQISVAGAMGEGRPNA